MKRLLVGVLSAVLTVGLFAAVPSADAAYYISKKRAEHNVRVHFAGYRSYVYAGASCRPTGLPRARSRTLYHRWTCRFVAYNSRYQKHKCQGTIRITGSLRNRYYYRVLTHRGPCTRGT
ncbi:hypothetical protein DSM112329_01869 [Paraconexibacter sp. AEG42_29]|uniref:Uncharacterized protein n=1 Tax=Paraconexibacter sp. AEG42_29 TaxID=2997339 RepID=A0AAU7ATV0_9ACTN